MEDPEDSYHSPTSLHSSALKVISGSASATSRPGTYSKAACTCAPTALKIEPTGISDGQAEVHMPQLTQEALIWFMRVRWNRSVSSSKRRAPLRRAAVK